MPTIPYACPGSQHLTHQILTPVKVPNNSNNCLHRGSLATAPTLPYAGAGAQRFTRKSLRLCRFPAIQTIAYTRAGFQQFTCKSSRFDRFPTLHTQTPDACTGSQQFRPSVTPGQPPKNSVNFSHN
ncbi:hypothetical protein O181_116372 [Austropuccinia psidii MF-1]|uniref:Uncharacterized protein n=1 Tax=Austropuccinia psidii MF-1 TaxID=1389203 RepID=A0A9Q3K981_9BASI|nr:hypothetical protein [Austropuccinia psidii MF-1]